MSELVVVAFDSPYEADRALTQLQLLEREYLIDLDDAVVAVRTPGGKVRLRQSVSLVGPAATTTGLSGALWGGLIGLLFLNPLAGMALGGAVGAGSGAIAASLSDFGINDDFIRDLARTIEPDSSALFLLVRKAQTEKLLGEFKDFNGRIIRSSLSPRDEKALADALADAQRQRAAA